MAYDFYDEVSELAVAWVQSGWFLYGWTKSELSDTLIDSRCDWVTLGVL